MKLKKIITVVLLCGVLASTLVLSGCTSCFSDKSSSGTVYDVLMVGGITAADDATVSGASWRAIKKFTEGTKMLYKYYSPSQTEINNRIETDNLQSTEAIKASYETQINIATAQKKAEKAVIVISEQGGIDAYLTSIVANENVKYDKTYAATWFLLVGAPSTSDAANSDKIATRTVSLIFDEKEYGKLIGYTAVEMGFKNIGYLGTDSKYSQKFAEGITEGIENAKASLSITDAVFTNNDSYDAKAEERAQALYTTCDIVIPENADFEGVLKSVCGDKKYVSLNGETSDNVPYTCTLDYEALQNVIQNTLTAVYNIGENKDVRTAEGIYTVIKK